MKKLTVCMAAMGIAGGITFSAMADVFVWQGASGGSWNEAAKWAGGVVPNASGAEVDFSAASGTYAVSVASAVTVGKIALNPTASASLTLSGAKITFAAADTPEVNVGANGTLFLQNATGGNQGLRKTGAGTYRPKTLPSGSSYSGRTYVDEGVMFPVKDSPSGTFGGSVEVAPGTTFKWPGWDMLASSFKSFANGGTFDMNGQGDYIGALTFSNGGTFRNGTLFIDDAAVGKITASGEGLAGTFSGNFVASSLFLNSSYKPIPVRTQEVNVVSANATLVMTGGLFDNRAQYNNVDRYKIEHRETSANPPPYRGQLRKTGAGDLLFYDMFSSLSGPTTVCDGRLILSNSIDMLRSTVKLEKGNDSLVVAPNATLKLSGLDGSDTAALDLQGSTLEIGGLGENAVFAGTLANSGANVRKISSNSQTFTQPQTQRDWDVLGGTLHFGIPAPKVWYAFDDPDDLGKDSGTVGKQLAPSKDGAATWADGGVEGGCASFSGTGSLMAPNGEGLPCGNSPFTTAMWIKMPTFRGNLQALSSWGRGTGKKWNGFILNTAKSFKHVFWEGENDYVSATFGSSLADGNWHHVAVTYYPGICERVFYVDGSELSRKTDSSVSARTVDSSKPFYLGSGTNNVNYLGFMDDVMVFDKTLSPADIATLAAWRSGGAAARTAFTPAGGNIRLESGATISFAHAEESFASISGRGTLALHDATATIAPAENATNEVGRLAGDGTLVKNGAGTLALSRLRNPGGRLDVRAGDVTAKGPAAGLKGNLVAWWTFDDPENPGADASGNELTLKSMTNTQNSIVCEKWSWPNRFKTTGGAVYFDGDNNNCRCLILADPSKTSILPHGNASFTVALWIATESTCNDQAQLVGWGVPKVGGQYNGFRYRRNTGEDLKLYHFFWGNDAYSDTVPEGFRSANPPTGWHHVAVTCDTASGTRTFYIDGRQHGQSSRSISANVQPQNLQIGWGENGAGNMYKGWMDDIMIFDKALSADEIRAVMQGVALEEPTGGMAAATASGTSFAVTDGQVAFSGLAATGTVSVAAAAEALFTGGENVLAGAVGGAGRLAVTNGASLSLVGGQNFGGTLDVRAGGMLALVPNANARVQSLQLAEGTTLAAQPAESPTAALVSTAAVTLPEALTVRVAVPESASGFSATLVESTTGLAGDVDDWTLDATLPAQGSWRASVRKIGNKVVLSVHPSGTCILFR